MADKKPVWVDEDAHALLKAYSKIVKTPMVELASKLVLERLDDLSPEAGLEDGGADEPAAAAPKAAEPEPAPAPKKPAKKKPARKRPDPADADVRYLGGVWLV